MVTNTNNINIKSIFVSGDLESCLDLFVKSNIIDKIIIEHRQKNVRLTFLNAQHDSCVFKMLCQFEYTPPVDLDILI